MNILLKLFLNISLTFGVLFSQTNMNKNTDPTDLEIDGLIVSETISKIGNDFYEIFYSKWEAPPNAKNYTITIIEKPFPFRGNLISVKINESKVYEKFIQPRYDTIVESAEEALQFSSNYLINYEKIQRDLGGEDLSGSGIF